MVINFLEIKNYGLFPCQIKRKLCVHGVMCSWSCVLIKLCLHGVVTVNNSISVSDGLMRRMELKMTLIGQGTQGIPTQLELVRHLTTPMEIAQVW